MADRQFEYYKALRAEEHRAAELSIQSAQHWTLAQSAAWIVFRDISAVAVFTPPRATGFVAYLMYREECGKPVVPPVVHEQWHDLFRRLEAKRLVATGCRAMDGIREPIPASAWIDLYPDVDTGPYLRSQSGKASRPWSDILVLRADVERLWRRPSEVDGRSKFDRTMFQKLFLEQRARDPELSANEIIKKVSQDFEQRTNREAPSFSAFKRYVKGL